MLNLFRNINFTLLFCPHILSGVVAIARQGLERDIKTKLWVFWREASEHVKNKTTE